MENKNFRKGARRLSVALTRRKVNKHDPYMKAWKRRLHAEAQHERWVECKRLLTSVGLSTPKPIWAKWYKTHFMWDVLEYMKYAE